MQLRLDKENRELKSHGRYEFPVNVSYEQLSRYERGSFPGTGTRKSSLPLFFPDRSDIRSTENRIL